MLQGLSSRAEEGSISAKVDVNTILNGVASSVEIGLISINGDANVSFIGIDNIVSLGDVKAFEYFKVYKWNVDIKQGNKLKTSYKEIELRKKERNIKWLLDNLDTLR